MGGECAGVLLCESGVCLCWVGESPSEYLKGGACSRCGRPGVVPSVGSSQTRDGGRSVRGGPSSGVYSPAAPVVE